MNLFFIALKNSFDFEGRARRKEYWYFVLFDVMLSICFILLDFYFVQNSRHVMFENGPIYNIYRLLIFIPSLSVTVRRLHDIGYSGWNVLLGLIPIIGGIWLLVLTATQGDPCANKYGEDPIKKGELFV